MATTKKDHQKWLKEWKKYQREVNRFVNKYEKYVRALPAGELPEGYGPGFDRPLDPPKFP